MSKDVFWRLLEENECEGEFIQELNTSMKFPRNKLKYVKPHIEGIISLMEIETFVGRRIIGLDNLILETGRRYRD